MRRCTVLGEVPVAATGKPPSAPPHAALFNFARALRPDGRPPRRRLRQFAAMLNGLDKFLLFVALPAVVVASLLEAIVLAAHALVRLARQRGLAVRPVRARRGADLPAAVDRDAADRARLPASHRHIALDGWAALLALFIGQEFCYYWFHRAAHRVRWFWCNHAVHHSANELNLSARLPHRHPQPAHRQRGRSTCR